MTRLLFLMVLGVSVFPMGCADDFDAFNLLNKLRVLAVRAEPPYIAEGQSTTLDALVYTPDGAPVTYEWSWCPFVSEANDGFSCVVDESFVTAAIASLPPEQQTTPPPFALGSSETITFPYVGTASLLSTLCDRVFSDELPDFVSFPDCSEGLPITIRLTVRTADDEEVAIKEVMLAFDPARLHQNPAVGPISMSLSGREEDAVLLNRLGDTQAPRAEEVSLFVGLDEGTFEVFTPLATDFEPNPLPRRESLSVTWFIEGGETDSIRTSFRDGSDADVSSAKTNVWTTPVVRAFPAAQGQVFVVVRDERFGVTWTQGAVPLEAQ